MDLRRWIRSAYDAVLFLAGCCVVAFLAFVIIGGLLTTLPLVTGFWHVVVVTVGRDRMQFLKIVSTALFAISAGAWSVRFVVRRINQRDDPEFARLPADDP